MQSSPGVERAKTVARGTDTTGPSAEREPDASRSQRAGHGWQDADGRRPAPSPRAAGPGERKAAADQGIVVLNSAGARKK